MLFRYSMTIQYRNAILYGQPTHTVWAYRNKKTVCPYSMGRLTIQYGISILYGHTVWPYSMANHTVWNFHTVWKLYGILSIQYGHTETVWPYCMLSECIQFYASLLYAILYAFFSGVYPGPPSAPWQRGGFGISNYAGSIFIGLFLYVYLSSPSP